MLWIFDVRDYWSVCTQFEPVVKAFKMKPCPTAIGKLLLNVVAPFKEPGYVPGTVELSKMFTVLLAATAPTKFSVLGPESFKKPPTGMGEPTN
jgi:hypothetical protein